MPPPSRSKLSHPLVSVTDLRFPLQLSKFGEVSVGTRKSSIVSPLNLAVVIGTLACPPRYRANGQQPSITTLDVHVPSEGRRAETVRVTWFDAPTSALELDEGDAVVVCGRVRRYWFANKQSATDVVAESVVVGATEKRTRRALGAVVSALEAAVA